MERTQRNGRGSALQCTYFVSPSHKREHTHTLTCLSLAKADLFPPTPPLCSAQPWVDQGSCLGYNQLNWRWRTLNPSLYLLLHPRLYSRQRTRRWVKEGVEENKPSPSQASDLEEKPSLIFKRLSNKNINQKHLSARSHRRDLLKNNLKLYWWWGFASVT